ncbi:MAG: PilZ domain-containing protein [Deltaproteobacteria bacterium]|nr:PilZ domain-containing protein [Deltaproteobacteria bacterium]
MVITGKRIPKRRQLIYYSEVVDQNKKTLAGYLIDISTSGIKLMMEGEVETDKLFAFEAKLPYEIEGRKALVFEAKSIWCKRDVNPDYYAAGFEIEKIDIADEKIIIKLMLEYGFSK